VITDPAAILRNSADVLLRAARDGDLTNAIQRAANSCAHALKGHGKIMFCGNGGSAADAQHLAGELVGRFVKKRPGLAAIALTADSSILTALANDFGYNTVFARQVQAIGTPSDVLIGITTSGASVNVLEALIYARRAGILAVALTGSAGVPADYADIQIRVPSSDTQHIQEAHIVIGHAICGMIEADLYRDFP
jgi:D-sedoheptulose 7-phosphate isomerase